MTKELNISKTLAPEDIQAGAYVGVLSILSEYLWVSCEDWPAGGRDRTEVIRVRWLPCEASEPLKVMEVCLPFVLVKSPKGELRTLDVRRHRLAQLTERYGRRAFNRLKTAGPAKLSLANLLSE